MLAFFPELLLKFLHAANLKAKDIAMQLEIRYRPKNHGSVLSASLKEMAKQITLNGKVNDGSTK